MWTYESIKEFIENRGYKLVSENYKNYSTNLILEDSEGFYYYCTFGNFKKHIPERFGVSNPYTIQNIKLWCKLNNKFFELVSDKYEGYGKKLEWLCLKDTCKEIFKCSWGEIHSGSGCGVCANRQVRISNCLATKYPDLINEWDYELNGSLTPYDVTAFSNKKAYWKCKLCNNSYYICICNKVLQNKNCSICGDHISYPNKFLYSVLNQLSIDFEIEKNLNGQKISNIVA